MPESEWQRMRAPFQAGAFPFPVRYGYAAAGTVVEGPERLMGRRVFALHPHQTRFRVPAAAVTPLPDAVPLRRAILAANMETAVNAVWDASPDPDSRIAIVGAGLLGCLIAAHLSRSGHNDVTLVDVVEARADFAREIGVNFRDPDAFAAPGPALGPDGLPDRGYDIAFHTTANPAAMQMALEALAFEGWLMELSWYGDAVVPLRLGGAFHSRRLMILSSQVGHLPGEKVAQGWTHAKRLAYAIEQLDDPRLDALITDEVAFEDLPAALPRILAPGAAGIATAIRY